MAVLFSAGGLVPWWGTALMAGLSIVSLLIVRRELGRQAALVAVLCGLLWLPIVLRAEDPAVVVYSECEGLMPADWLWWVRGCWAR